jgi:hypothetical protein
MPPNMLSVNQFPVEAATAVGDGEAVYWTPVPVVEDGEACTVKLKDPTDCPPTLQFSYHWPIWDESMLPDSAQFPLESVVPIGVVMFVP